MATPTDPPSADPPPAEPPEDRPRDADGRARSNRPRDGLGRPLPYGATGVERQPEGVVRTPEQTLAEARRLLEGGKPFHAHEVFEDAWKGAGEPERELWRGLAQLAVGLTHAARGNPASAATLLRRGAVTITPYRVSNPFGIDVGLLVEWADSSADECDDAANGGGSEATPAPLRMPSGWSGQRASMTDLRRTGE
ncbi:hypothetical protein SAMN05892883_0518 [Jatrophihabitans sp. GAS493]|uniref:DUF309 domain-containing protein n=1 Tax=Jatrophihabitans sp. GAS493 TaxID=1907575 RepID=UPI000BB69540|nr:DUF309 domain-containing protein [Jatrophihabitans sp. GAS493]SOD70884.1 hypothetical protein SAMN05892883_0518 [Jatrophihabitans sp. GAS493]